MQNESDAEFVDRMEHDWVHDIIPNSDDADRLFALARRGAAMNDAAKCQKEAVVVLPFEETSDD